MDKEDLRIHQRGSAGLERVGLGFILPYEIMILNLATTSRHPRNNLNLEPTVLPKRLKASRDRKSQHFKRFVPSVDSKRELEVMDEFHRAVSHLYVKAVRVILTHQVFIGRTDLFRSEHVTLGQRICRTV